MKKYNLKKKSFNYKNAQGCLFSTVLRCYLINTHRQPQA